MGPRLGYWATITTIAALISACASSSSSAKPAPKPKSGPSSSTSSELGEKQDATATASSSSSAPRIQVSIYEGLPEKWNGKPLEKGPTERYDVPALGFAQLPIKYNARGAETARALPLALHAETVLQAPAGSWTLILRARNLARVVLDGEVVLETPAMAANSGGGHERVPPLVLPEDPRWRVLAISHRERRLAWRSDGKPHRLELWAVAGGKKHRPELGETSLSIAAEQGVPVLVASAASAGPAVELTDAGWPQFAEAERQRLDALNAEHRLAAYRSEDDYWAQRHEIARRHIRANANRGAESNDRANPIDRYFERDAKAKLSPAIEDSAFFRRLTIDAVGIIPTPEEAEAFLAQSSPTKRADAIDARLADPRWADAWIGYWQDVLAENPGVLKPTLNNTGPFRRYLRDAFRDNLAFDRFVTTLIRMEGSEWAGAPAGFGLATQNDAPMAAKAHVLAKAFLAAEMKCARCHDAPQHPFDQSDLFGMAGMLAGKSVKVPVTSTVKVGEGGRVPAISITLKAGEEVAPHWSLLETTSEQLDPNAPAPNLDGRPRSREALAALITSPKNPRFAKVIANRMWKRYMGFGLVEPVDDWDNDPQSRYPELLNLLADELVAHDYDLKHIARLILTSRVYQAQTVSQPPAFEGADSNDPSRPIGPIRRKMAAEPLVDSLFAIAGKPFRAEELTVDPEARLTWPEFPNLGVPRKAWEFAMMSNERDRPALTLPVSQTITEVLEAFGWRNSRQDPISERETSVTPMQPAILANGLVANGRIARLSDDSAFTRLCLEKQTAEQFVRSLYLRILSRPPAKAETERVVAYLGETYQNRLVPGWTPDVPARLIPRRVSWANHLSPEATMIQLEAEKQARRGDTPTKALTPEFRERAEDVIWALINHPEFVFLP